MKDLKYLVPPGELNDSSKFHATDHTVFEPDKFPGWGHGYKKFDNF